MRSSFRTFEVNVVVLRPVFPSNSLISSGRRDRLALAIVVLTVWPSDPSRIAGADWQNACRWCLILGLSVRDGRGVAAGAILIGYPLLPPVPTLVDYTGGK